MPADGTLTHPKGPPRNGNISYLGHNQFSQFSSVQSVGYEMNATPTFSTQKKILELQNEMGAVGRHHARWKDPVSYIPNGNLGFRRRRVYLDRIPRSLSRITPFSCMSVPFWARGESSGSGLWRRTWTRTHFYKCCVRSSRPQDIHF